MKHIKLFEQFINEAAIRWQDAKEGDSALVKDLNKLGLIVKAYGRKFHLKFPDGSDKTYDVSELEFITNEGVSEAESYKLGDKWSHDFDYDGMLEMGSKAKVSWGAKKLQKLQDSFTDVNYHSESQGLGIAIDYIEDGDKKGAVYYMDMFNDACKASLGESESVNEGKQDYSARYDGVDINLKNGYKYLKDHELEDLYTKIGKLLKGKTTMAKRVDVVF